MPTKLVRRILPGVFGLHRSWPRGDLQIPWLFTVLIAGYVIWSSRQFVEFGRTSCVVGRLRFRHPDVNGLIWVFHDDYDPAGVSQVFPPQGRARSWSPRYVSTLLEWGRRSWNARQILCQTSFRILASCLFLAVLFELAFSRIVEFFCVASTWILQILQNQESSSKPRPESRYSLRNGFPLNHFP